MKLSPSISLHLHTADGVTVDPVENYDHVTVYLGPDVSLFSADPAVMEACARAFWDASDELHAKAGVTTTERANVAKTLDLVGHAGNGRSLKGDVADGQVHIDPDVARTLAIAMCAGGDA